MSGKDVRNVLAENKQLFIYGYVRYRIIGGGLGETRFCVRYHIPGGFNPLAEGFVMAGPNPYHQAT